MRVLLNLEAHMCTYSYICVEKYTSIQHICIDQFICAYIWVSAFVHVYMHVSMCVHAWVPACTLHLCVYIYGYIAMLPGYTYIMCVLHCLYIPA